MKPAARPLIILFLILLSLDSRADGNYLLERCQAALDFETNRRETLLTPMAYCYGLLQGIRELNALYERKDPKAAYFCLKGQRLEHREAAEIIVDYLNANPDRLGGNETTLAVRAFRQRFPCG